jgi:hypothetical protein
VIEVLLTAASGLPLQLQLKLKAVFNFLSIVALFIAASVFCLDRHQELMLQLEAHFSMLTNLRHLLAIVTLLTLSR